MHTFWVDVDQSHGVGAQRPWALALHGAREIRLLLGRRSQQHTRAAVVVIVTSLQSEVGEGKHSPVSVSPYRTKAQHWPTHGLNGDVGSEDDQVAPRQAQSVLLLDGPQQTLRLVQIGVVIPGSEVINIRFRLQETLFSTQSIIACTAQDRIADVHHRIHRDHRTYGRNQHSATPGLQL